VALADPEVSGVVGRWSKLPYLIDPSLINIPKFTSTCRVSAHGCHFEDDEYEDWLGVFGRGDVVRERNVAVSFYTGGCALVSAWGRGYVVNVNTRQLVYRPESDMLVAAVAIPGRDFVIACDYNHIHAFGCNTQIWRSKRIAGTYVEFLEVTPDAVSGRVTFRGFWKPFTLHLNQWLMTPDLDFDAP
jgi:hypothetical protein